MVFMGYLLGSNYSALTDHGLLQSLSFRQCGGGQSSSQTHGLYDRRRHNHHGAFLFDRFVEHVHGAQMERDRILGVTVGGLYKLVGNSLLRLAQNDSRLALAFGLHLPRHGVFPTLTNFYVAYLDRLHADNP